MFTLGILVIVIGIFVLLGRRGAEEPVQRKALLVPASLLLLAGPVMCIMSTLKVVDAGNVGVVSLFGKVDPDALPAGMHMVNPLSKITEISIRTQEYTMSGTASEGAVQGDDAIKCLSKDGLPLPIDVTINYRPQPSAASWLYRNLGTTDDFVTKIVRPSARAAVREAVASYTAQEAYSTKREALTADINRLVERYIDDTLSKSERYPGNAFVIQQVLVRNIELPDKLKQSIEAKLTAEQEALRMEYVLQKERQEAERKRIEARGIADFQTTINSGLSDKLLQWKGIEATQELAKSDNAKIVVIGGKDGLPLILNSDTGTITKK